jgi:AraC-like DNA-binding protein
MSGLASMALAASMSSSVSFGGCTASHFQGTAMPSSGKGMVPSIPFRRARARGAVHARVWRRADLNELLIRYCEEALERRGPERTTLRSSVENAMAPLLPHGKATAVETARRIGMSRRTLVRKLSSDGLTFSEISEELKVNLAKHYLRDGDLPISQVAWLLGYREISAFTHAFRRWTGMTPSQLRTHGDLMPVERVGKSRRRVSGR